MARFGTIGTQYFDSAGEPLASGLLYFYESGTTTAKATYADINLTVANTNPVVLNADGTQPNIFFDGSAKVILTNSAYVQIDQKDPIGGESDTQFGDWSVSQIYGQFDFVTGSDGNVYRSVSSANQGNNPVSDDGSAWEQTILIAEWQSTITFASGDLAQGSDGFLYVSKIANNLNNDPTTDSGANWQVAATPYTTGDVVFSADTTKYISPGWLPCDGTLFNTVTYPQLAAILPPVFLQLADPATIPDVAAYSVGTSNPWTSDGIYTSISNNNTSPYFLTYKRSGSTFTKIPDPSILPTGEARDVDIDSTDTYWSVAHNVSPFVTNYSRSGDVLTKLADPGTLPAGVGYSCKFSPSSNYLAVGHDAAPRLTVYQITAGPTFTKLADPATVPPSGAGYSIAWTNDESMVVVGVNGGAFIYPYTVSGATLTYVAAGSAASGLPIFMKFDSTDTYLACAINGSPWLEIYKKSGTSLTKLSGANIVNGPNSSTRWVDWDDDDNLICGDGPNTPIQFERSGDIFTGAEMDIVWTGGIQAYGAQLSPENQFFAFSLTSSPFIGLFEYASGKLPTISVESRDAVLPYIRTGE